MLHTKIANAMFLVFQSQAETGQSTAGGSKRKGKQEAPVPDAVMAAARIAGASQGKDAVPAGKDYTRTLTEIAQEFEVPSILGQIKLQGKRIEGWIKVGEIAQAHGLDDKLKKDILDRYIALSRGMLVKQLFHDVGMAEAYEALGDNKGEKKTWPELVQKVYDQQVGPRLSETRRVMAAFEKAFVPTIGVLTGKGTIQSKLVSLPRVSSAGKKKGTPNENKGGTGTTTTTETPNVGKPEQKQAEITDAMQSQIVNVNPEAIPMLMQQLAATGRRHKLYQDDKHYKILMDSVTSALAKYEAASAAAAPKQNDDEQKTA